jgi:hypothetical protein
MVSGSCSTSGTRRVNLVVFTWTSRWLLLYWNVHRNRKRKRTFFFIIMYNNSRYHI